MENTINVDAIRAEAVALERERIRAILALDEAKDRPTYAEGTAYKTDMSVDEAKAFLANMPCETAQKPNVQRVPQRSADAPGGLMTWNAETGEAECADPAKLIRFH